MVSSNREASMFREFKKAVFIAAAVVTSAFLLPLSVQAKDKVIGEGVYIGHINVSGMTTTQAQGAVNAFVSDLGSQNITLVGVDGNTVETNASVLGLRWENPEVIVLAGELGKNGNVVQRYKELHDIKINNRNYDLQLAMDPNPAYRHLLRVRPSCRKRFLKAGERRIRH